MNTDKIYPQVDDVPEDVHREWLNKSLAPNEISDRQFLGWNVQTRSQLVEDLYYVCRANGEILEELLDEYVYELRDNVKRLDELQSYVEEEDIIHN